MKKYFYKKLEKYIKNAIKEQPFYIYTDAETYLWRVIRGDIVCDFLIPLYYGLDKETMIKYMEEDILLFEKLYKHFLKRIK